MTFTRHFLQVISVLTFHSCPVPVSLEFYLPQRDRPEFQLKQVCTCIIQTQVRTNYITTMCSLISSRPPEFIGLIHPLVQHISIFFTTATSYKESLQFYSSAVTYDTRGKLSRRGDDIETCMSP